jgi:hypothetical protein
MIKHLVANPTHSLVGNGKLMSWCGKKIDKSALTKDKGKVTCKLCKKTYMYK